MTEQVGMSELRPHFLCMRIACMKDMPFMPVACRWLHFALLYMIQILHSDAEGSAGPQPRICGGMAAATRINEQQHVPF